MIADCVFIPKKIVDETLEQETLPGKRQLEPLRALTLSKGIPLNILEDTEVSNNAEAHRHEHDLWICLSGEVEFYVGGSMISPVAKHLSNGGIDDRELSSKELSDTVTYLMKEGDVLWIPAGQPHQHRTETSARLFIIKIPVSDIIPLADIPGWQERDSA